MDWERDPDAEHDEWLNPASPRYGLRVAGALVAAGLDLAAVALFAVAGLFTMGFWFVVPMMVFPWLQLLIVGPLLVVVDRWFPDLARGMAFTVVAVFGLWAVLAVFFCFFGL